MALPSDDGPKYQVQQLSARHQTILQMIALGLKNVDIAEKLGISPQSVSIVRNSQLGRAKLTELVGRTEENLVDLEKRFKMLGPLATDTLEDLMTDPKVPSATRANIAKDLLDRAGHKPVERRELLGALLTSGDINHLKESWREREKYGPVVDADSTPVNDSEPSPTQQTSFTSESDASQQPSRPKPQLRHPVSPIAEALEVPA